MNRPRFPLIRQDANNISENDINILNNTARPTNEQMNNNMNNMNNMNNNDLTNEEMGNTREMDDFVNRMRNGNDDSQLGNNLDDENNMNNNMNNMNNNDLTNEQMGNISGGRSMRKRRRTKHKRRKCSHKRRKCSHKH